VGIDKNRSRRWDVVLSCLAFICFLQNYAIYLKYVVTLNFVVLFFTSLIIVTLKFILYGVFDFIVYHFKIRVWIETTRPTLQIRQAARPALNSNGQGKRTTSLSCSWPDTNRLKRSRFDLKMCRAIGEALTPRLHCLFKRRYSSYYRMSGREGEKASPVSCMHWTKRFRPLPCTDGRMEFGSTRFCDFVLYLGYLPQKQVLYLGTKVLTD
jgi:hypothetical protein